jgi:hypothetical protein
MPSPVPPWLHRVQFIAFYAFNPCDAEMSLYVEMAKAPVGRLAAFILIPSVNEIVENFFQPRGLRSKRHGRKGRKGGKKGVPIIPDVDDMVARRLPGYEAVMGRPIGSGTRWIINGINQVDRVVFPLVLVDQVTNTLFDTIIGVIESDKATCPNIGRMLRSKDSDIIISFFGWHSVPVGTIKYIHNINSPFSPSAFVLDGTYSATVSATVTNGEASPMTVSLQLIRDTPVVQVVDELIDKVVPAFSSIDILVSAKIKGPTGIRWQWKSDPGTLGASDISAYILQIGN